jgi:hypothetical protein
VGGGWAERVSPHRLTWAALLARAFALDVTVCPACGGRRRLIAAQADPASVRRYLQASACRPSRRLIPPRAPTPASVGLGGVCLR